MKNGRLGSKVKTHRGERRVRGEKAGWKVKNGTGPRHGVPAGPLIEASDRLNALAQWSVVTRRVIVEQPAGATPTP
jgi:hypothetical protein